MGRNRWPSVFELEHRCARRRRRRGTTVSSTPVVLVALAILTTACAAAPPPQTPSFPGSPSWSALSRLSEGENIIIGLRSEARVPGTVGGELSASFLKYDDATLVVRRGMLFPGARQRIGLTILPRDVVLYVRIRVREPHPTGNGTVIGLLIGLAATATTIGLLCTPENDCPFGYTSAIFLPLGSAAGAFIGRSYARKRTDTRLVRIYQAR